MEHIGHAAWRVLQNARKAAVARKNEIADAKRRDAVVFGQTLAISKQNFATSWLQSSQLSAAFPTETALWIGGSDGYRIHQAPQKRQRSAVQLPNTRYLQPRC